MPTTPFSSLKYSDITPRGVYLNRRKFLYAMGLAGGLALAGEYVENLVSPSTRAYASTKLAGLTSSPFSSLLKNSAFWGPGV